MKLIRKMMVMCVLITGLGTSASLLAADAPLPDAAGTAAKAPEAGGEAAKQPVADAAANTNANNLPALGEKKPMTAQESREKDVRCTSCHDESETTPILALYQNKHGVRGDPRTPNCQTCHGESEKHLKGDPKVKGRAAPDIIYKKGSYEVTDNKERAAKCLTCHKGAKRNNWDGGQHDNNQVACNDCHKVHTKADKVLSKKTQTEVCYTCHKEQRAESHKASTHPIAAGKVVCSDCHNPHGGTGPKLLKKATVTETCYTCHAEKRGPFLFEHQPVTEDCANCHTPHGSNIAPLLKSRAPFLCQECHDGTHSSGTPVASNAAGYQGGLSTANNPGNTLVGNACMNCHRQVHGSNSPAGGYLQR